MAEDQAVCLNLVDINQKTVEQSWPLLLQAVEKAHFNAVDLELSGLGSSITRRSSAPDQRYKLQREVVISYSIISMGVACFQWQPHDTISEIVSCKVEVFNILLLSQQPYTVDPCSAQFLLKHGFDFNRQLGFGLPYSPMGEACKAGGVCDGRLVDLFHRLLLCSAPLVLHNGWMDLLFLYHTCHAPLPPTRDAFIADLAELLEHGGLYDTKAIARYHFSEESSFLEYVYKKSLVCNQRSEGVWLQLVGSQYPELPVRAVESVMLPWIPDVSTAELASITVCRNITRHGACELRDCQDSHSLTVAILQEKHSKDIQRLKRKRNQPLQTAATVPYLPGQGTPLIDLFKQELAVARQKLTSESLRHTSESSCDPVKQSYDSVNESHGPLKEVCDTGNTCGHRAGFDAFMTGYTFACYALNSCQQLLTRRIACSGDKPCSEKDSRPLQCIDDVASEISPDQLLEGLSLLKNCLNNRGQTPVRIAHSQYSKPSDAHRAVWGSLTQHLIS